MDASEMNVCLILLAAGASSRFRSDSGAEIGGGGLGARSKLDEDLGGRPVLHRALELFTELAPVRSIVVAGPRDPDAMDSFRLRHIDKLNVFGAQLIPGGVTTRAQSVAEALQHVPEGATHVAVHDAARPITPSSLIERVLDAALTHDAVVPAIPVADTIKRAGAETIDLAQDDPLAGILGDDAPKPTARLVAETIDRANLFAVQTPQVFKRELLLRAYAEAGPLIDDPAAAPDDAALVERLGEPVLLIEGDASNVKITRPVDLAVARAIAGFRPPKERPSHLKF